MKKFFASILLILNCFTAACGTKDMSIVDTEPFSYETMRLGYDSQPFFEPALCRFARTDNGYYYFDNSYLHSNNSKSVTYLMYFDEETETTVPVCNRTDCTHTADEDCDAIFGTFEDEQMCGDPDYLWYYNNNLYTMIGFWNEELNIQTFDIYQISLDGSTRTKLFTLIEGCNEFNIYCHRGWIYASFVMDEDTVNFYRAELKKGAKPQLLYECTGVDSSLGDFQPYETGIVFLEFYYNDESRESVTETLRYYNPVTGEITDLMNVPEVDFDYVIIDDIIYYQVGLDMYTYNIETGETTEITALNEPVFLSYDGKYIYGEVCTAFLNGEREDFTGHCVYVLDFSGNILDRIQINSSHLCFFGDENYLFHIFDSDYDSTGANKMPIIKAFDKSQIGTGVYEWIELPLPACN